MLSKILVVLAAAVACTGCSSNTPPPVTRAPGSYTALNLPVLADKWAGGIVQLATKDKKGCGQFVANILPSPIEDDYLVDIEGNRDIFFHIARTAAQTECNKIGLFYATKGNEYIVKFDVQNKQCEFSLLEKTPDGVQHKISTYTAYVSNVDGARVCENKSNLY
jgi:hypothetical protein